MKKYVCLFLVLLCYCMIAGCADKPVEGFENNNFENNNNETSEIIEDKNDAINVSNYTKYYGEDIVKSNTCEIYTQNDAVMMDIKLYDSMDDINQKVGEPNYNEVTYEELYGTNVICSYYDFGYIWFEPNQNGIYRATDIIVNQEGAEGPRDIKVGDDIKSVLDKYYLDHDIDFATIIIEDKYIYHLESEPEYPYYDELYHLYKIEKEITGDSGFNSICGVLWYNTDLSLKGLAYVYVDVADEYFYASMLRFYIKEDKVSEIWVNTLYQN